MSISSKKDDLNATACFLFKNQLFFHDFVRVVISASTRHVSRWNSFQSEISSNKIVKKNGMGRRRATATIFFRKFDVEKKLHHHDNINHYIRSNSTRSFNASASCAERRPRDTSFSVFSVLTSVVHDFIAEDGRKVNHIFVC